MTRALPREGSPGGCATGECVPEASPAPAEETSDEAPALSLPQRWRAVVAAVRAQSPRHGASLAFARVLSLDPGEVRLAFSPQAQFHRATLVAASGKQRVEQVFTQCFGRPTLLRIDDAASSVDAFCLAEEEVRVRAARVEGAEQQVREHAALRDVLRVLGGEVEHIQLLDPAPATPSPNDLPEPG